MPFDLSKIPTFATRAGVYLMKDQGGEVLYVGKAKNLRQRIRQYFVSGGDGRVMVPHLISQVQDIDTIIVSSEKEALLLENNLIKKHRPRYNALLKDDKAYLALKVTTKDTWPMVCLVRYKGTPERDGLYFGPYTSAEAARSTLDLLHRTFPLRQCSDQELARRTRPCILYQMKRCLAPCVDLCTREEYQYHVERTVKFLKGQDKEVIKELYQEMMQASDALDFERANVILKTIRQIEKTIEAQHVDNPIGNDADVLGIFREGEDVILCQLQFRRGRLTGSHHYSFSNIAQEDSELLRSFLLQHYLSQEEVPNEILLPIPCEESEALAEILTAQKGSKVVIYAPQRGAKAAWVKMADENAKATFLTSKDEKTIREKTLLEMQEKLHLTQYPMRIECFDNSNLSGAEWTSSMAVFTDGKKDGKRYRTYRPKQQGVVDEYSAMKEVLGRRYKRAKEENDLPDLVVVDGGKAHLNIALQVFSELNVITVDVIAMAKEDARHDKGLSGEQVFLPNRKDPILLKKTSPVLFLLQRIRDEAHRVAITAHRKRRSKVVIKSALDDVPGIGPVKKKLLLTHFGSMKNILQASEEELLRVKGISKANVKAIKGMGSRS